jgi:hypothetical protein
VHDRNLELLTAPPTTNVRVNFPHGTRGPTSRAQSCRSHTADMLARTLVFPSFLVACSNDDAREQACDATRDCYSKRATQTLLLWYQPTSARPASSIARLSTSLVPASKSEMRTRAAGSQPRPAR